jgi:tetratricopeptide (TPR) repeat protein
MLTTKDNGEWTGASFFFGLELLRAFSLIKLDPSGQFISMHVLVNSWARHRMKRADYQRYSLIAKVLVTEALGPPPETYNDIYRSRVLAPHIEACYARTSAPLVDSYEGRLMFQLGWHYQRWKKFSEAEQAFLKSLQIYRTEFGHYADDTIETLRCLGLLYHEMGRLGEAELALLEVIERLRGKMEDVDTAIPEQRVEEGSSKLRNRAFKSFAALRLERLSTSSLAPLFRGNWKGLLDKTNEGAAKAREAGQTSVGTNSPCGWNEYMEWKTLSHYTHADLGRVYMDQGWFHGGLRVLKYALSCLEEDDYILPNDLKFMRLEHEVKSLTEPGNLSYWLERGGRLPDLEASVKEGLWEKEILWHYNFALANCALKNGAWNKALAIYENCLKISERFYGDCDKHCLEILRRMVDCLVEREECDAAISLARDCVGRARRLYGERHKETALALEKLHEAVFWKTMEHSEEGESILVEALATAEAALGPTHSIARRIRGELNRARRDLKRPAENQLVRGESVAGQGDRGVHAAWVKLRANIEELKAEVGPNHLCVRRWARFVGDSPPKTLSENNERVRACFGPHSSLLCEERAVSPPDTECDGVAGPSGARGDRPPVYLLCTCGEAAHAEGSQQAEKVMSGSPRLDSQHLEIDIAGATGPEPLGPEEPDLTAAAACLGFVDVPEPIRKWYKLRNVPVYRCGTYYPFIPEVKAEAVAGLAVPEIVIWESKP